MMVFLLKGFGISASVLFLFFKNIWIVLPGAGLYAIWNLKNEKARKKTQEKEQMALEFREVMIGLSVSLTAGVSVENAWITSIEDMELLYGERSVLIERMREVYKKLECNESFEVALLEFAQQSEVDEIIQFAEIFQIAKRAGGNLIEVTRDTSRKISERMEVEREIRTMLAGKQMEGKIMKVIPLGIIGYFWLCSPGFLDCLYQGAGRGVMSVFFVIYLCAYKWSERIGKIAI